jgi:hypothetical protein
VAVADDQLPVRCLLGVLHVAAASLLSEQSPRSLSSLPAAHP